MSEVKDASNDPNEMLPVIMKVRCKGPRVSYRGFVEPDLKCGQVYLRIIEKHDRANEMDLLVTKTACPKCKSEEWEPMVSFNTKGTKVMIKRDKEHEL